MSRVLDGRQLLGVRAVGAAVKGCGGLPLESLVGSLLVIETLEVVEAALLSGEVGFGRACGFVLESSVHPLVRAILLGLAGKDPLVLNAEAKPPDVELREAVNAVGGEGDTVVGSDGAGQTEFPEQTLEDREDPESSGGEKAVASQQAAAVEVRDRQRITVEAVPGAEMTFEVSSPEIVGMRRYGGNGSWVLVVSTPTALLHHPPASQQIACGADGRPLDSGVTRPEPVEKLSRPPAWVLGAGGADQAGSLGGHAVGTVMRSSALVLQSGAAALLEPIQPFVAGLATDPIALAELAHGIKAQSVVFDESLALFHG
jgi:hypothetical protein